MFQEGFEHCNHYYCNFNSQISVSMSTQGASSSSSSSSTPKQSFRKVVVDLVLFVWRWIGVWLFRNNEEIERGKSISLELVKEKEESSQGASMSSPSPLSTPQWKYEA
ncbi:hypothetical protein CMV_024953 [Castanea mollissima]|uniref:Uncharacterized protein n=1 Tax=Castanea mollissima TaxID=60419 RepID=A0A8J4QLN9_9ROSI|nr:hypothetical protein CMV_024953 [Castanea mollissima]